MLVPLAHQLSVGLLRAMVWGAEPHLNRPERRVPGPELCSVLSLPPDVRLSQPKACVGASSGFCHILSSACCMLLSIPREFLPSGFVFTPRGQTAHRTIKMAPLRSPRAIPALHSQSPGSRVWQGPPLLSPQRL